MSRRVAFTSPTRAPPSMEVVKEREGKKWGKKWGRGRYGKRIREDERKKESEKEDKGATRRVSVGMGETFCSLMRNF